MRVLPPPLQEGGGSLPLPIKPTSPPIDYSFTFISRHGFFYHATCTWVRLLGPCFKTGRTRLLLLSGISSARNITHRKAAFYGLTPHTCTKGFLKPLTCLSSHPAKGERGRQGRTKHTPPDERRGLVGKIPKGGVSPTHALDFYVCLTNDCEDTQTSI